jgi:Zn-dependent protease with chaperone function/uncharacterized RDD family membrane protein YckC
MCLLASPVVIALVGLAFPSVSVSEFVLLIVGAMLFVSVGRGRLLGSSIRIDGRQLPEIDRLVSAIAAKLDVATPQIFIRDDFFVPIAAVGVGDPYALVLSSQYVDHLHQGELAFLIGRELGHIAAGHSRITSLLSTSGRENPVVALVFGAWLRRMEYTADRVGLLCCNGPDDAIGAIAITTFHSIGRRVDMAVLAEQRRELDAEPTLRMGEWVGGMPYATNRLQALRDFELSPLAARWRNRLETRRAEPSTAASAMSRETVSRHDCSGVWRRLSAMLLDLVVIDAILKSPVVEYVPHVKGALRDFPEWMRPFIAHLPAITLGLPAVLAVTMYFLYGAIFVGISGQTLGMMIMDLRVVTTRFARPSPAQAVWRYAVAFGSLLTAFALLGFFFRVHPHDRLSRTRVVFGRRSA